MMLKRSTTESKPSAAARLVRAGVASLAAIGAVGALVTGCLDRDVVPATPTTSNVFVDQIVQTAVDKIDLLFMVDNSVSMADKQEILKDAVPVLVSRLITPICLKPDGTPAGTSGNCTGNTSPEFNPIGDIHIGIVSSSLGAHGGTVCSMAQGPDDHLDDQGHLIGTVRTSATFSVANTWNNSGFLAWDSSGKKNTPPGVNMAEPFKKTFQDMIEAVGEHGCGYEAQLESWYRFLIDPEPPLTVMQVNQQTVRSSKLVVDAMGKQTCMGCDDTLLAQRKAFLRPDSLVAIIMLSDENDCSIVDSGYGWFVGSSGRMPLATTQCDANPNDPCCRSCVQGGAPPAGCGALADDAHCKNIMPPATFAAWDMQHDSLNLRCYNQHQRFGFDLLYGTDRYVSALKNKSIPLQSSGVIVPNPLYDSAGTGKAPRDPSLVFLAGIVGVPWQDIADDASQTDPKGLTYLTAQELAAADPNHGGKTRWDFLLGAPGASPPVPPADPFMIETPLARTGTNSLANPPAAIVPPTSTMPHANAINGHEWNIPNLDDLQYACIFPLKTPRPCVAGDNACDCSPDKMGSSAAVTAANSPLCQGGTSINQQTSAKGYPGARELTVLRDFGDNAIVASICPKVVNPTGTPDSDPNYGYNPAVGAIIERLKEALKGKCLPRTLQKDAQGQVLCKVIEAQKQNCDCGLPGRGPADPKILDAVRVQLASTGNCDGSSASACKDWCECEIKQLTGPQLNACQQGQVTDPGYCYVDEATNPALISKCPPTQRQLLNFTTSSANPTPAPGAVAFIACLGAPT